MWQIIAGIKKFDIYGQILVVDGNWWNLLESLGKLITSLAPKFGHFWTWMESDGDSWNLITSLAPKILERHGNSRTGHIWQVGGIVWNSHLTISSITSLLRSLELGSAKPQKCIYSPPFPSFVHHQTQHSSYLSNTLSLTQ